MAGPCPLRGMRTATVATGEGARLAAVVSLMLASATLADHAADGDGALARRSLARAATRLAQRWTRHAQAGAAELGLDAAVLLDAVARQPAAEHAPASLLAVTEPTETATGAAFAHTAVLAGRPANIAPLSEAGRLFGRLAHLLDAVEDLAADARTGAWNPLVATGTDLVTARRHADDAVLGVRLALADVTWASRAAAARAPAARPRAGPLGAARLRARVHGRAVHRREEAPAPPGERRGLVAGCGLALASFCTCQMCCAEHEGPWSGQRRAGVLRVPQLQLRLLRGLRRLL